MTAVAPSRVPVDLRPLVDSDVDAVLALDARVHLNTWSSGFLRSQLADPTTRTNLVAEVDGQMVGHAALLVVVDEGHVISVTVDSDRQRSGIGTVLLAALFRDALVRGLSALTLEVRVSNEPAIGLYQRFGFAPAGIRKGYYADSVVGGREDALVMWAHDIADPAFSNRVDGAINRAGGGATDG